MNQTTIPAELSQHPETLTRLSAIDSLVARAQAVQVSTPDEYQAAVELCGQIAAKEREIETERLAITRPMDEAKKRVMDFFGLRTKPLQVVEGVLRNKLRTYLAEQRRIADQKKAEAEAQAKREREALEKKAREERERAEQKAREQRQEAERLRREQEAAKAIGDREAAAKAAEEARKAEAKATQIETRSEAKVEALEQRAATTVAPLIMTEAPKAKGAAKRTVWRWEVIDPAKIDRKFLTLDTSKIDKQVKALKADAVGIIGEGAIRIWEEEDLSIRAAKP